MQSNPSYLCEHVYTTVMSGKQLAVSVMPVNNPDYNPFLATQRPVICDFCNFEPAYIGLSIKLTDILILDPHFIDRTTNMGLMCEMASPLRGNPRYLAYRIMCDILSKDLAGLVMGYLENPFFQRVID